MNQMGKYIIVISIIACIANCVCVCQTAISSDSLYHFLLDIGETEEQSYAIVHDYARCPYGEQYSDIIKHYLDGGAVRKNDSENWKWYPVYIEINSKRTKYVFSRFVNDTTLDYPDYIYNSYIFWNGPQNEWINEFTRYMYHKYNVISALPLINDYYSHSGCKGICAEDKRYGYHESFANSLSEKDEACYHYYMMAAIVYNLPEDIRYSNILQKDINQQQSKWSKIYEEYISSLILPAFSKKKSVYLSKEEISCIVELLNKGINENDNYCIIVMAYALLTGTIIEQDIERGINLCKQANVPICYTLINYFKEIKERHYSHF